MSRQTDDLVRRQQQLLVRSSTLRRQFALQAEAWQQPLAWADRARAGWRWLREHPEAPLAGLLLFALLRPRRVWRMGWRVWTGWRLWRQVQQRLAPLGLTRRVAQHFTTRR